MLPVYTYVWLFGEESACTTGRWVFCCSDIYSECGYMKNSVPWKRIHSGGRWIDASDHMYIENLAVNEKQRSPFLQRFFFWGWGGTAFRRPPEF